MTQYIPYILSTIAICVTLYSLFHKEHNDEKKEDYMNDTALKVSLAQQETKLDMILNTVSKIELHQEQQSAKVEELTTRIVTVEASCKSLHKRVDKMESLKSE